MRFQHKSLILLLMAAVAALGLPCAGSTEPVHAQHGIVVSVHELASRAGVEMMQAGGNAVDAAVATGFALAVVHPAAGNLGGGGFMLVRMANGKTHFLDYREMAPAAATRDMYLDAQGNVIEGASEIGYKAIGVPGSVAGMVYAEQKYGKLTLKQVMAPAIRLAHEGYALSWGEARSHGACFSGTEIIISPARLSVSLIWRGHWNGLPQNRTTSITGRWRASSRPQCRKVEG
jgi:gamma-glutamyltranspeptidase/glutathione hydrolase